MSIIKIIVAWLKGDNKQELLDIEFVFGLAGLAKLSFLDAPLKFILYLENITILYRVFP